MEISFDPAKRAMTLLKRGLDFADAGKLFAVATYTVEDDRVEYPERRFQTYGMLDGHMLMIVWTEAPAGRRVISMRKCNDREQRRFGRQLG